MPNPVTSVGYTVAARIEQGRPVFVHDDGQGLWTLTHTEDFAVGLAGLIGNEDAIGETFQITSDCVLTWNQIMAETCRALGVDDPEIVRIPTDFICAVEPIMDPKLRGDKAHHGVFDNAKIKRAVPEFECKISFREGIRRSVEWFRAAPERQTIDPKIDALFDRVIDEWRKA
jgi:nucleoside-diphosphate-sugar epimerase